MKPGLVHVSDLRGMVPSGSVLDGAAAGPGVLRSRPPVRRRQPPAPGLRRLWVGSSHGLLEATDGVVTFESGSNDQIRDLRYDGFGRIWALSADEIIVVDPT